MTQRSSALSNSTVMKPEVTSLPESSICYPATSSDRKEIKTIDKKNAVTDNPNSPVSVHPSKTKDTVPKATAFKTTKRPYIPGGYPVVYNARI